MFALTLVLSQRHPTAAQNHLHSSETCALTSAPIPAKSHTRAQHVVVDSLNWAISVLTKICTRVSNGGFVKSQRLMAAFVTSALARAGI